MAKILVVEDDNVQARAIQQLLEGLGHDVVTVVDSAVIENLPTIDPDILLVDFHLGGEMGGMAVVTEVLASFPLPVIYLVDPTAELIWHQLVLDQVFGCLFHPFQAQELQVAIATALHRHQTEKHLDASRQKLATLLSSIGDAALAIDDQGSITFMNPVAEHLTGWPCQEALGKPVDQVLRLIHGETRSILENPLLQSMRQGSRVTLPDQSLLIDRRGSEKFVSDSAAPIQDQTGQIVGSILIFQDITDRTQEEIALRESQAKFKSAFRSSPDPITITNLETGQFIEVNDSFCRLTGYQPSEVIGRSTLELNLWAGEGQRERLFQCLQREGVVRDEEYQFRIKSGQIRVGLLSAEVIELQGRTCLLAVTKDITDRKASENVLRLQAQREQALNRVIQAIRNSLDLGTIFSTAVREVGQFLGVEQVAIAEYRPVEKLWQQVAVHHQNTDVVDSSRWTVPDEGNEIAVRLKQLEIVRVDDTDTLQDEVNRSLAQRYPGSWLLVPLPGKEGVWGCLTLKRRERLPWQDSEVLLVSEVADQLAIAIEQARLYQQVQQLNARLEEQVQERTTQLQTTFELTTTLQRITERVRDSLDESQILQTVVQELVMAFNLLSCNTSIYDFKRGTSTVCYEHAVTNQPYHGRVLQMHNFPEIYGHLIQGDYFQSCSLIPNADRGRTTALACPILDDQGVLGDLWLVKQADYAFTDLQIRLVQQIANQCAIAIRQARLYQAAQAQVTELARLNRLKDDFLSTISHELRTPLSNLQMAIQMMEIRLNQMGVFEDENERLIKYFQILKTESQREIRLVEDLLQLSHLETQLDDSTLTRVNLSQVLNHLTELFSERVQHQQQHLQVELSANLPTIVTNLPDLERIVVELLDNACKYTPIGHQIVLSAQQLNGKVVLQVTNTGVEIPPEELPHVFDQFYRVPNNDPWQHGGTGLGLTLVQRLVQRIGASIQVESGNNQVRFTLELAVGC